MESEKVRSRGIQGIPGEGIGGMKDERGIVGIGWRGTEGIEWKGTLGIWEEIEGLLKKGTESMKRQEGIQGTKQLEGIEGMKRQEDTEGMKQQEGIENLVREDMAKHLPATA